jgi:hypothetical protein
MHEMIRSMSMPVVHLVLSLFSRITYSSPLTGVFFCTTIFFDFCLFLFIFDFFDFVVMARRELM